METQQVALESKPIPIWPSIREALRGSHQDFTSVSLNRAILLLAIPMVLEMVLESLFAVVDVFWVGRLGADAVATIGLTESMLSLVFAVGLGLSMCRISVERHGGTINTLAGTHAIALAKGEGSEERVRVLHFHPHMAVLVAELE